MDELILETLRRINQEAAGDEEGTDFEVTEEFLNGCYLA